MAHNTIGDQCAQYLADTHYPNDTSSLDALKQGFAAIQGAAEIWGPSEFVTSKQCDQIFDHVRNLSLSQQMGLHDVFQSSFGAQRWADVDMSAQGFITSPAVWAFNIDLNEFLQDLKSGRTVTQTLLVAQERWLTAQNSSYNQKDHLKGLSSSLRNWGRIVAGYNDDPQNMDTTTVACFCAQTLTDKHYPGNPIAWTRLCRGFEFLQRTPNLWTASGETQKKIQDLMTSIRDISYGHQLCLDFLFQALVDDDNWVRYDENAVKAGTFKVSAVMLAFEVGPYGFAEKIDVQVDGGTWMQVAFKVFVPWLRDWHKELHRRAV